MAERERLASVRGGLRLALTAALLLVGTPLVLLAALLPVRVRGARLPTWGTVAMARLALRLYGVRVRCAEPERLRRHRGLVFLNHLSFADSIVLLALGPVRFLSNHHVRRQPLVGWMARALETTFVNRRDRTSRAEARQVLARQVAARPVPPLVLFPEGRIGDGERLGAFFPGAFGIAIEAQVPYLLGGFRYRPLAAVHWYGGESFWAAVWRLAAWRGPLEVEVQWLAEVQPEPDAAPLALARQAEQVIGNAVGATAEAAGP